MSKLIAFVGNPNVGKSVIFNKLTGQYAVVSNYAGTTVDVTRGNITIDSQQYQVVDTPGIYSLMPPINTPAKPATINILQCVKCPFHIVSITK